MTVHYPARFVAEGGPPYTGPTITPMPDDPSAVVLMYDPDRCGWTITDSAGNVYANAHNPARLKDWFDQYLDALEGMYIRGELG